MSTGFVTSLSSNYLQSVLNSALQSVGRTANKANESPKTIDASAFAQRPDSSQLSPFAQLLSKLQQLEQADPTKYRQVTQQIATNLQSAAQTAQSGGNNTAANQLNQLASDFNDASKSGQLPNIQDLAQAVGGHPYQHHQHHHHAHPAPADADATATVSSISISVTTSTSSITKSTGTGATSTVNRSNANTADTNTPAANTSSTASPALDKVLAAYRTTGSQNDSLNPLAIILHTLSSSKTQSARV